MYFQIAAIVSALAAIAIGIIGGATNPSESQTLWMKIGFALCFGLSALFGTLHSLKTNCVSGDNGEVSRQKNPAAFWVNIVFGFILSAAILGALVVWLIRR